ncbi:MULTISPECIES: hypothetical protein [unclassified Burkholderia]|uniref:hypothetical protein n=1 Tax=unclassified Burkholderia TaxID=2613784 RepID=UPI000F57BC0A|nr:MULTISPECIES: hypothetical protein [unclassified Burkholderia]
MMFSRQWMRDGLAGNSAGPLQGRTMWRVCEISGRRAPAAGVGYPPSQASELRVEPFIDTSAERPA